MPENRGSVTRRTICLLSLMILLLSACSDGELREGENSPPAVRQETASMESQEGTDREETAAAPASDPGGHALEQSELPGEEEPKDTEFVRVTDYIPGIEVDLRYASADNFTGQVIYDFSDAYLRYGTVKKLSAVQETLAEQGYGLKIWDAFRPTAAQFVMWEICPDGTYVADPNKGFSSHSRGNTVDLTLVGADGTEAVMPTGFDDFSAKADRDYSDADPEAAANALLLENAMTNAGFRPYFGEWWHFSDTEVYDVEEEFLPESGGREENGHA